MQQRDASSVDRDADASSKTENGLAASRSYNGGRYRVGCDVKRIRCRNNCSQLVLAFDLALDSGGVLLRCSGESCLHETVLRPTEYAGPGAERENGFLSLNAPEQAALRSSEAANEAAPPCLERDPTLIEEPQRGRQRRQQRRTPVQSRSAPQLDGRVCTRGW